ncbi:MAG TPA: SDR family NAD(P)-dependent oxidoreductase [Symbiobacteriaceae bacterium]|nr:SDR family NAD(P)-dependent oxidoreductase [Symbiobacteriaceae bacterium]
MRLSGNTVLVTGGASGIGLAFAERFLQAGSEVIICGRRAEKLEEAKQKHPGLHTRICDVSNETERIALFQWAREAFPGLNLLVNNAGVQHRINLVEPDTEDWTYYRREIATNFDAPVHLSLLFLPLLAEQQDPAIINVSSGLAFTPMAIAPIYCATKAAVHSFTVSLRYQAAKRNVTVIEVAPPAVNTDLGGPGLHTFGAPLDEFAHAVFQGLEKGDLEIGYGRAAQAMRMSRDEIDAAVEQMNNRRP